MLNYYDILNVSSQATSNDIKKAYKSLALQYHPDKNAGNKNSEEAFKLINEAYQVLSDNEQRRRHDLHLDYASRKSQIYYSSPKPKHQEKSVYDRYGRYNWKNAPQYKTAPVYKIDKNYYRNVSISFIVIIIFSALALGISKFNEHLNKQEEQRREAEFNRLLTITQETYDRGEFKIALLQVQALIDQYPMEYRFGEKKDHLVKKLNKKAITEYQQKAYSSAVGNLEILKDFQKPVRISNWKLMADCYLKLHDYQKAARTYEFLLERDDQNIELMLRVAELYEELGDKEKVKDYYNEARYTFKKLQEYSYGSAYEFVIDPKEVPESYYNMFKSRAVLMMEDKDFMETIKDCNWGIFLRPERSELYVLRAEARYQLNQINRACNDLKRAKERGYNLRDLKFSIQCGEIE